MNISSLVVNSSRASYLGVMKSIWSVGGCRMLLRSIRVPIGVDVWLSKPKRQSFDLGLREFCMISRDWKTDMSIIIVSCEGWYRIRSEWETKVMVKCCWMYFIA